MKTDYFQEEANDSEEKMCNLVYKDSNHFYLTLAMHGNSVYG